LIHYLKVRRRLNKEIDGKLYWKYYIDIPIALMKEHGIHVVDTVKIVK